MPSLSLVLNLQVTLIPGMKQGPVKLTMVPPSMCPFSGAKVSGRLVPTVEGIGYRKSQFSSPQMLKYHDLNTCIVCHLNMPEVH